MKVRAKWLMKHPIQANYLLIVILAMLIPTLLIGFCLYNLIFNLLAKQMVFPEAIMANLVPVIKRVNVFLMLTLPIATLIILWFALVISHRFAGPIERLEGDLDQILAGDYEHRVQVRKRDDLVGVTKRINMLLRLLRK